MSRGQKPRTPDHFPAMRWRARKRVDHQMMLAAFGDMRCSLRLAADALRDPKLAAALDEITAAAKRMLAARTEEAEPDWHTDTSLAEDTSLPRRQYPPLAAEEAHTHA